MTEIIKKFVGKIQKIWHFKNISYPPYPVFIHTLSAFQTSAFLLYSREWNEP